MLPQERIEALEKWIDEHKIEDIECITIDMSGVGRGKSMPPRKFLDVMGPGALRLPEAVFAMTITGDYVFNEHVLKTERDLTLIPDLNTICVAPWQEEATAAVICDVMTPKGELAPVAPRTVLKNVLKLYDDKGWQPVVAPEFEFYLLEKSDGPSNPMSPPAGATGWRDRGSSTFSIDAADDFGSLFDDVYDYCEAQGIEIDTLIHEDGPAQFEINFNHGDALNAADRSIYFKRVIKKAALKHGYHATFMAKPYPEESGSSMHLHQSIVDKNTGKNIFAEEDGSDSKLFRAHIAGLQTYLPKVMPILAPYFNSYRRLAGRMSSPVNTHWARENRTAGLRVPTSDRKSRRIENRVSGADANPYLVIAASLGCGYLGMVHGLEPSDEVVGSAHDLTSHRLPIHYLEGLEAMENCDALREIFSDPFLKTFIEIKRDEHSDFLRVLSPWETRNLTLSV